VDWGIVGTITAIVSLALIVFGGGRYVGKLDELVRRHDKCPIFTVTSKIETLTARFDMFLAFAGKTAANVLISPHTPQRDEMLKALANDTLTESDARELLADMEEHIGEFAPEKTLAAILVIVRLKDRLNGS